jgi:hypothetical protein
MSSHIYQDELIFPFDDPLDVVMNDDLGDENMSYTSYQYLDHKYITNEEDYQEYDAEDNPLCHLPNSMPKNDFAYDIPQSTIVQRPHITVGISGDLGTMLDTTTATLGLDCNRNVSPYFNNMNSFEGSLSLSNSGDTEYFSRTGIAQNAFSNNVYTPYMFDTCYNTSLGGHNLSPPNSFNSQNSPPCEYNTLVTLPNSPPQAKYSVSASPEGHTKRTHNSKQLTCEICHKCFGRPQEVTRHQVCHTGEKNFGCLTCYKKFARRDALLRHNRSHSTLKIKDDSSIRVAK